ncbi:MAG: hypothetical protein E7256_03845 [Lachnospiraceae bacterium]|nr:hypothetical protein [Lachnospiraceae bacterium]
MYIAIIGDIKESRKLGESRNAVQEQLNSLLEDINERYKEDIQSYFLITLGDEFQGLLKVPDHVLDIIEYIELNMYPVRIRFGIGIGKIDTGFIRVEALGADGTAYYNAREMVDELKIAERSNKTTCSYIKLKSCAEFGDSDLINAGLHGLCFIEQLWTDKQREVIHKLRLGMTVEEIEQSVSVVRSSIYRRIQNSGYYDYKEIHDAITKTLDKEWRKNLE